MGSWARVQNPCPSWNSPSKQQATQYVNRSHYKKVFFYKYKSEAFSWQYPQSVWVPIMICPLCICCQIIGIGLVLLFLAGYDSIISHFDKHKLVYSKLLYDFFTNYATILQINPKNHFVKLLELVLCSYFLPDMNAPYLILTSINRSIQSYYMIFSPNSTILQINPKNHFLQGPMSWEVAHIFRSPAVHVVRGPCPTSYSGRDICQSRPIPIL